MRDAPDQRSAYILANRRIEERSNSFAQNATNVGRNTNGAHRRAFRVGEPDIRDVGLCSLGEGLIFLSPRVFARVPTFLCAALVAAACVAGCSDAPSQGVGKRTGQGETAFPTESAKTVAMTRAIDGDTVEISPAIDGIEDVRLIGVDTPELSGDCGTEPLAREAEDYTARHAGERVTLEFDEERVDQYDRLLAYV